MKEKRFRIVIHTFTIITILAYAAMLFFSGRLARVLFTIGGSSCYIVLGLGSAPETALPVSILCLLWLIVFPVTLTISYILTYKKYYIPFCVVTILDFVIVVAYTVYALALKDLYAFESMLPDVLISFVVVIATTIESYLLHKEAKEGFHSPPYDDAT